MKKEGVDELRKIFESNNKKVENKEKEKLKQNEKGEKVKSNTFTEKNKSNDNFKDKNIINKSVYINSTNINKLINVFNNPINNKEKENKNESTKQSGEGAKEKEAKKNEIKKLRSSDAEPTKSNLKDKMNKFSNVDNKTSNPKIIQEKKKNIKPQEKIKITNENKEEKEINNINFKDKVSMFNNFIEKNRKEETVSQDYYTKSTTHYIKDTIKNITKSNFDKDNNEVNEYKQTFDTLHNLQIVLKKESSLRELRKNKNIIFF